MGGACTGPVLLSALSTIETPVPLVCSSSSAYAVTEPVHLWCLLLRPALHISAAGLVFCAACPVQFAAWREPSALWHMCPMDRHGIPTVASESWHQPTRMLTQPRRPALLLATAVNCWIPRQPDHKQSPDLHFTQLLAPQNVAVLDDIAAAFGTPAPMLLLPS